MRTHPPLVDRLAVERRGPDEFEAVTALPGLPRLFGGEVAARALVAAQETLPTAAGATPPATYLPHSLHCSFLLEGSPEVPLLLRVTRLRDGRSFATRRVDAVQRDRVIFTATVSFHRSEPGPQRPSPFPEGVPAPDPALHRPSPLDDYPAGAPFEIIELLDLYAPSGGVGEQHRRAWVRAREPLPADPAIHLPALTYLTDLSTGIAVVRGSGTDPTAVSMLTSLDHALWVHRPPRVDDWLLVESTCTTVGGARGLVTGTVHGVDGTHVATFAQEALLRTRATA